MSAGVTVVGGESKDGTGVANSARNFSKPGGDTWISMRAGTVLSFLKACGMPRGPWMKEPALATTFFPRELECDFTLQHEEGLILAMVNVRWRAATGQHARLAQRINAAGLISRSKNAVNVTDSGERRAFVGLHVNELGRHGHDSWVEG